MIKKSAAPSLGLDRDAGHPVVNTSSRVPGVSIGFLK